MIEVLDDGRHREVQLIDAVRELGLKPPLVVANRQVDTWLLLDQRSDLLVGEQAADAMLRVAFDDEVLVEP